MVRHFEAFICPAPRLGPFSKSACGKLVETLSPGNSAGFARGCYRVTEAAALQEWDGTTEAQGGAEEAHRGWPEGRSEQGASKATTVPPILDLGNRVWFRTITHFEDRGGLRLNLSWKTHGNNWAEVGGSDCYGLFDKLHKLS